MMNDANKRLVQQGYDTIAEKYETWTQSVRIAERQHYESLILARLPAGAMVLELGCGSGIPTTKCLSEKLQITGIDLSEEQINRARTNVPDATFIQADMTQLDFSDAYFDGIVAFYSITHVPCDEHATLFENIHRMLKPGGLFVAALSINESNSVEQDWLGVPMYFSHFGKETNLKLLEAAGFQIEAAKTETDTEFGTEISFLWVVCRKL